MVPSSSVTAPLSFPGVSPWCIPRVGGWPGKREGESDARGIFFGGSDSLSAMGWPPFAQ